MTDPKIETVQTIYEAFGRGDVPTILAHLTDDVDWASESFSASAAPWAGVCHGKDEVPRFFQALGEAVEVTDFTPLAMAANDDDVFVTIRFGMKGRATGNEGTTELHHWWTFRDGLVSRYRGTEDTALTAEILGL